MPKSHAPKLKKIAKRVADRDFREQTALIAATTPADHTAHHKAVAKAMAAHIEGITPLRRELDALQVKSAAATMATEKKRAATAVKRGRARKPILAGMISQRVRAFEAFTGAVTVPGAQRYLVNTPIEIVGSALNFQSFAIVPSNSWVKFRMEKRNTSQRRSASVIFRFVWDNTQDKYVVINVNGYFILHGHCYTYSDGGIFGGDRAAGINIKPTLKVIDWTNEPFLTLGTQQIDGISSQVNTGTVWDDAAEDPEDVFRGYDLDKSLILVPPRTSVGLVMSAEIDYYAGKNSGIVQANFADGAYMVGSPAVLVTVVS